MKKWLELAREVDRETWYILHSIHKPELGNGSPKKADKCTIIVWKDRTVVVFYTNVLNNKPRQAIEEVSDYTIDCVNWSAVLHRRTVGEAFHRTPFQTPAIIVACNMFMSDLERYDQIGSANITMCKDNVFPTSIFMVLLDSAIRKAYAVWNVLNANPTNYYAFRELKRRVAEIQATPQRLKRQQTIALRPMCNAQEILPPHGNGLSEHTLLHTQNDAQIRVTFCKSITGRKRKAQ